MNPHPSTCTGCIIESKGKGFTSCSGMAKNGVLLLGAAPSQSAETGFQLNKTLQRTALLKEDFAIDHVCKCTPPNGWLEHAPWEHEATTHCDLHLQETIKRIKPKVIIPMGNVALYSVLGERGIGELRGYVHETRIHDHNCFVVPTYEPYYILRGKDNLTGIQIYDIQRGVTVAQRGYREPGCDYIEHPTQADLQAFLVEAGNSCAGGGWLAADIETPRSGGVTEDEYGDVIDAEIICISFSFREHTAITVRWTNGNWWFIESMLGLPWAFVLWWNKEFDIPRIKSKGILIAGTPLDGMELWRFAQSDISGHYGLGSCATFFTELKAWKHLSGANPEFYSCRDSDATVQCVRGLEKLLQKEHRWSDFIRHIVDVDPLLAIMGRSGVLIDQTQRTAFRAKLQADVDAMDAEIQLAVPDEVHPFTRKTAGSLFKEMEADVLAEGRRFGFDANGEWGIIEKFNWASSKQLIGYMKFRKHPVPRKHDTDKETANEKAITDLAKKYPKDPLYGLIIKAKQPQHMISTYIDGQEPDVDGRLRTRFTFKPATGRLASESANVQNQPKRGELAKLYRKQFVPAPGYMFCEADFKAFQAVTIGYLAGDEDFIKAAKLGVHAILASHVLAKRGAMPSPIHLDADPAIIRRQIKAIKLNHGKEYDDCKHVVYGSSFGGTGYKMHMDFPDSFPTLKSADEMQKMYFSTIGRGVKAWQTRTIEEAHRKCYLETPFRQRCYFWNLYQWNTKKRQMEWGPSAKDALAFMPQAIERAVMTEAIKRIFALKIGTCLRWTIHDSLGPCEIPLAHADDIIGQLKEIMEMPVPELDGLSFEVDVKVSEKSWADEDMIDWKP